MVSQKIAYVSVLISVILAGAVRADTLGDILDKGAKKLGKEEWSRMLPASMVGAGSNDFEVHVTFAPDGTLSGTVTSSQGLGSSPITGTWVVDDTGKRCVDEQMSAWNLKWNECGFLFRLGDQYFSASSDTDRGTVVSVRSFSKGS